MGKFGDFFKRVLGLDKLDDALAPVDEMKERASMVDDANQEYWDELEEAKKAAKKTSKNKTQKPNT